MMAAKKTKRFFQKYGYVCLFSMVLLIFLFYPNVGIYDWDKEVLYTSYIKTSLLEYRQFPLFLWNSAQLAGYPAVDQSAFFAANPETMLFSPFLPLLLFLSPVAFLKLLVVLNAALGIVGICMLGKRLDWQRQQLRIFSAFFLFSPIVIQHVAIGYLPWLNLYWFPWLLYFLLSEKNLPRSLGSGMVLALVLLQGGSHIFVWFAFFVVFYILWNVIIQKRAKDLLSIPLIFLFTIVLALPRFYLSLQSFASFAQRFFSGYSLRAFFKWGLIPPFFTPASMDDIEFFIEGYIDGVPYWDGAIFWGLALILVFLIPFLFLYLRKGEHKFIQMRGSIIAVNWTSVLLLVLSLDGIYEKLISAISNQIGLPALEGMEKYPFRFAIPAYLGFTFVIAATWLDWPGFLQRITEDGLIGWKKLCRAFFAFCNILKKHRKVFGWLTVVLSGISGLSFMTQSLWLDWLKEQITLAYQGQGALWLARMMQGADRIPLAQYINKAITLYRYVQHLLLVLTVFFFVLWLLGFLRSSKQAKPMPIVHERYLSQILEALLVIPLLLAFGMWWRGALATPQQTVSTLQMMPPEVSLFSKSDSATAEVVSYSPLSVQLNVKTDKSDSIFTFDTIPAQDARFLKIVSGNASFLDLEGTLGLRVSESGTLHLEAEPKYILLPAWIAGTGWVIGALIFLWMWKEEHAHGKLTQ
jgi:hypothetical protein